jgi:hypothetical protein
MQIKELIRNISGNMLNIDINTNIYPVLIKSRSVFLLCISQADMSVGPGL